jgi:hypothetical protein
MLPMILCPFPLTELVHPEENSRVNVAVASLDVSVEGDTGPERPSGPTSIGTIGVIGVLSDPCHQCPLPYAGWKERTWTRRMKFETPVTLTFQNDLQEVGVAFDFIASSVAIRCRLRAIIPLL